MSVDLSECKVGDKVQLKNGEVVTIIDFDTWEDAQWPWVFSNNCWYDNNGLRLGNSRKFDAIGIIGKIKTNRNIAKFNIGKIGVAYLWYIESLGVECLKYYKYRKNAIRGARRFCKRIGFECQIVDGGDK